MIWVNQMTSLQNNLYIATHAPNLDGCRGGTTRADGAESAMGEFHLAIDTFDTQFAESIEVPEELRGLPMISGSGNVRDLQQIA